MAQVIYTPRNYLQIYNQMEQFIVGSGVGLTNFNVGSRIRTILEAVALVSGQTHYEFYQSLVEAIPVALYDGFGFERNLGTKASGSIKIGVDEAVLVNTTVPSGIELTINGNAYVTTSSGTILAGQTESNLITLQSVESGISQNLSIGDVDTKNGAGFFSGDTDFNYAYNVTAIGNGTDTESDADRRIRFATYINGLTKTTVLGIQSRLLKIATVRSIYVREYFPIPGYITIYIDDGSGTLPPSLNTEVNKVMYGDPGDTENYPGYKAAGIRVNITAPTLRHFLFTLKLTIDSATLLNPNDIVTGAESAISSYCDSLRLGEDFILSQAITASNTSSEDIIDSEILAMSVDAVPIVPPANVEVDVSEICRADAFTSTFDLIVRT